MNKAELIDAIAASTMLPRTEVATVLNAYVVTVAKALKDGDSVSILGFGVFKVRERAARQGRNPKTGEVLQIAASRSPGFTAGKAFKDAI